MPRIYIVTSAGLGIALASTILLQSSQNLP